MGRSRKPQTIFKNDGAREHMKRMMKFFRSILIWFFPEKIDFGYKFSEYVPQSINDGVVYVISEDEFEWVIIFLCPCGCREKIELNLLPDTMPNWTYLIKEKRISVHPSIDRLRDCKSHFFIKEGLIKWCK